MNHNQTDHRDNSRTARNAASEIAVARPRIFWVNQEPSITNRPGAKTISYEDANPSKHSGTVTSDPLNGSEALKSFACGIADNFNDLLMGIQGWVSVIRLDHVAGSPPSRSLRRIDAMVHTGALSILKILAASGRGVFAFPDDAPGDDSTPYVGCDLSLMQYHLPTSAVETVVKQWPHGVDDQASIPPICRALTLDFADLFFQIERELLSLTGDRPVHRLDAIKQLVEKGKAFLRQLYRISSVDRNPRRAGAHADVAVTTAVDLWRRTNATRSDIVLEYDAHAGEATVAASNAQVHGIIATLLQNALDAMPAGGHLCLDTSKVEGSGTPKFMDGLPHQEAYVRIAVSDTGHGMDSETMNHMFSPFYSTRIRKDRLGMGLAALYARVKALDGYIHVHSRLGHGTTMVVLLPVASLPLSAITGRHSMGASTWQTPGVAYQRPLWATA